MGIRIGVGTLIALTFMIGHAKAGLLPVQFAMSPEGADSYRYTYSVRLQSDSVLKPGDYFTIFDFDGLAGSSNTQPAGFNFSSSATGVTPSHLSPDDDPQLSNLTWTYTGAEAVGPGNLGDFTAVSRFKTTATDSFTGQTHRESDGLLDGNVTVTKVPVPSMPTCHQVSEPGTWLLIALGIPLAIGFRLLRRRV